MSYTIDADQMILIARSVARRFNDRIPNPADVDDIEGSILVRFCELRSERVEMNATFLFKVAKSVVFHFLEQRKSLKRSRVLYKADYDTADAHDFLPDEADRILAELKPEHRELVKRYIIDDDLMSDIARDCGMKRTGLHGRLRRATTILRDGRHRFTCYADETIDETARLRRGGRHGRGRCRAPTKVTVDEC